MCRIIYKNLPIQTPVFRVIIAYKVIKGIAPAENITDIIYNHILVVHPPLGFPGFK